MDEREIQSLFSGAPEDAPPSTFTKDDVVRESKRQTLRKRNRITAGAGAFVLVAVGFGTYGLVSGSGDRAAVMNSAVAPAQPGASAARPLGTGNGEAPNFSARPSQQGDSGTVKTDPRVEGASGCEKVDWELATALAGAPPRPLHRRSGFSWQRLYDGDARGRVPLAGRHDLRGGVRARRAGERASAARGRGHRASDHRFRGDSRAGRRARYGRAAGAVCRGPGAVRRRAGAAVLTGSRP
jgi:hypothetical protein